MSARVVTYTTMLERYETNPEAYDLSATDYFADLPQIEMYGELDQASAAEEDIDIDTSVIGVPDDRTDDGYEISDISISSLIEAANIARTAASLGVVISPERALRAGQIRTGEVVVDPEYRDNGKRPAIVEMPLEELAFTDIVEDTGPTEEQGQPKVPDETVPEKEEADQDQALPELDVIIETPDSEGDLSDVAQPTESAVSNISGHDMEDDEPALPPETAHEEVDSPPQPVPGDGGDKPPTNDEPPSAAGVPEENPEESNAEDQDSPQRYHAHGQLRQILRQLGGILEEAGIDMSEGLTWRQKKALPLLTGDGENSEVATQLGISPDGVPRFASRILDRVTARVPDELIPRELLEPTGLIVPEGPNTSVGGRLNALRASSGVTVDSAAEILELSSSTLTRFFAGKTHPRTTHILRPLLDLLGVSPEEAAEFVKEYKAERLQANKRLRRPQGE